MVWLVNAMPRQLCSRERDLAPIRTEGSVGFGVGLGGWVKFKAGSIHNCESVLNFDNFLAFTLSPFGLNNNY